MKLSGIILAALPFLAGCSDLIAGSTTYTLYRSSVLGEMRIHVATFDADGDEEYNRENCKIAASLFANQPSVKVRYWCEKGKFEA